MDDAAATLGTIAGVIDLAAPADLRAILETVGVVIVSAAGVRIQWEPVFRSFVPDPVVIGWD